jgi:2-isopropylmalate synthase
MNLSRRVSQVSGFPVQFNKAIVGKNAFLHESGIHQDGVLKNVETFEIMRPADIGITETNIAMGKHSGRAALRSKLADLGFDLAENQLNDVFVRFKALADRKKEIYDEDLVALMADQAANTGSDFLQVKWLRVICGSEGQSAELKLLVDGVEHSADTSGDGPVDAAFRAVDQLYPHHATLQLYQVHAVTEGTDAQATVSVRMEEDGRIVTGSAADTDTILASVKAYVGALNRLRVRREKTAPDADMKQVSFKV